MTDENNATEQDETTGGDGEGDKSQSSQLIADANRAAERLEKANKKREEILRREEELAATKRLGGKSVLEPQEKPKDETPQEYAKRALKGNLQVKD